MSDLSETPNIPSLITVHLGPPDLDTYNVTVPFPEYIKNAVSSEIYPTWPENTITAIVYAKISFALNRIYNNYYRSNGYDFDITNNSDTDQTYVHGRCIFGNISKIVDGIFNEYIKIPSSLEPFAAKTCTQTASSHDGLIPWECVEIGKQGRFPYDILCHCYGKNLTIVHGAPIKEFPELYLDMPLKVGDKGENVLKLQNQLNIISNNYHKIPKIFPVDGTFTIGTKSAVKKFQHIFDLKEDGIVRRDMWYKLNFLYSEAKKLTKLQSLHPYIIKQSLNQRMINSSEITVLLEEGSTDPQVRTLQYYLSVLGGYYTNIPPLKITNVFDKQTKETVIAAQKFFGLPQTGIVDDETWNYIYNYYITFARGISDKLEANGIPKIYPFGGTDIGPNAIGDDVRLIQFYINIIATRNPEINTVLPSGIYDKDTRDNVITFQRLNNLPQTGIVDKATWDSLSNAFCDILSSINPALIQYPGFPLIIGQTDEILKNENKTTGTPILNLEVMLHRISYFYKDIPYIVPNGLFGTQTLRSVIAFQKLEGLPQTGIVDENTWDKIVDTYEKVISPAQPSPESKTYLKENSYNSQDYISFLEVMFNAISKKYSNCCSTIESDNPQKIFDTNIKEMQKVLCLSQTGVLDIKTYTGIINIYNSIK